MAIDPLRSLDLGEHGQFVSDPATGVETFWEGAGVSVPAFALPCPGRYSRTNGEVYFNADGLSGSWSLESSSVSTDHHSATDCIEDGETLTIETNKQMVVYRQFKNSGTLVLRGTLILRCG